MTTRKSATKSTTKSTSRGFQIGTSYLIRSVTHYYTGRLVAIEGDLLVLEDAAWIANTGRYADCLRTGTLGEVEPCPGDIILGRGAFIDAVEWTHPLPRAQK